MVIFNYATLITHGLALGAGYGAGYRNGYHQATQDAALGQNLGLKVIDGKLKLNPDAEHGWLAMYRLKTEDNTKVDKKDDKSNKDTGVNVNVNLQAPVAEVAAAA